MRVRVGMSTDIAIRVAGAALFIAAGLSLILGVSEPLPGIVWTLVLVVVGIDRVAAWKTRRRRA
jgi:hypothetical protein